MGSRDFPVVGVGSSAGGIMALQGLFSGLPPAADIAFVVVQHTTAGRSNHLVRLLESWSGWPVHEAVDGVEIESGSIYLAPAGTGLVVENGVFATRPLDRASARAGIDVIDSFFESLALDCGARAIGVVLSGTGSDGAAGAVRIRQSGGMVLVQDPATAMHDAMPAAAIASGAADHIMPLGPMAQELVASTSPTYLRSSTAASWAGDVSKVIANIVELIRAKAGFDLHGYKSTPLVWRIQRRMDLRHVPTFGDYEALLRDDPAELEALVRGIPIHVTEFFRDQAVWAMVEQHVVPEIFREANGATVRAWIPACSTGQEAYSLAMLFAEHAATLQGSHNFQVFATDASAEIVARASRGVFREAAVSMLDPGLLERYFYMVDGSYRVRRTLREKMVFAPQDLLADPPLGELDFVSCRNLLIYLEAEAARRVVYQLHSSLRMGGFLFLGRGESLLSGDASGFEIVAPNTRIYRKVARAPEPADFSPPRRAPSAGVEGVAAHAHQSALEELGLPAVLVDERFHVLRVYGDTSPFLRFKPGEPSLDLLQLMPAGALLPPAAQRARLENRAVIVSSLADPSTGEPTLDVRLTPLPARDGAAVELLVTFIRDPDAIGEEPARDAASTGYGNAEGGDWTEALRLSHEELEAFREELMALNEELRASNEQLNVANEDLSQANAQLREKVVALQTQSDVLSSGAVMALFLDEHLQIRWFTPEMSEMFPFTAGDIGRRITDLAARFDSPSFVEDARAVIGDGEPREGELQTFDGRWFLKRVRPFRTGPATGSSLGVAIIFTDVTERKRGQVALRDRESALQRGQVWLAAQNDAFEAAMNGAPLATSLGFLTRAVIANWDEPCRCALYLADADDHLNQVVGTSEDCGDYRGCWSFPVETSVGKVVGSFAMYFPEPREPTARDREVAGTLTKAAAIIISKYRDSAGAPR